MYHFSSPQIAIVLPGVFKIEKLMANNGILRKMEHHFFAFQHHYLKYFSDLCATQSKNKY